MKYFVIILAIIMCFIPLRVQAAETITRQDMAVRLVNFLGYGSLAAQVESFEANPFTDVHNYIGYIIIANDLGLMSPAGFGIFDPHGTVTIEEATDLFSNAWHRSTVPLSWVHGFYAFGAFAQRYLIHDMDSVSFGWSQMEWDAVNGARLNTSGEWRIPEGYQTILDFTTTESGAKAHLNVFMDTTMGLDLMIACQVSRSTAVAAILNETALYSGVTINFEGLRGEQSKADFTAFLTELAANLRPRNLSLYVTVHPSTIDGIYFDGYDFRQIGYLADRVILMAHDYHPRSLEGFMGTEWQRNAALTPIAEVYRALKSITDPLTGVQDRSKIAIAFNFASIGWFVDEYNRAIYPRPVTPAMDTVIRRMSQPDTHFGWSYNFRNPYIIYNTEAGERVFLWHENARSVYEKLKLARLFNITGASIWRIGIIPNAYNWDVWPNFSS